MYEVVKSEDVFHFVDRANPGLTNTDFAREIGTDESRVRQWRKANNLYLTTADRILSHFGLNYLLATGDIPTYFVKKPRDAVTNQRFTGGKASYV